MKKILQINVSSTGSTGRISREIGNVWKKNGFESFIAYGRLNSESTPHTIKIGDTWTQTLHGVKTRLFDLHGFGSYNATKALVDEIGSIRPDVILLHNLHGYYLNIDVLFSYLKSIETPVIWILHDCWTFTGHCTFFENAGCYRWESKCYECPQKHEYPTSWLVDNSTSNFFRKKELFNSVKNMHFVTYSSWLANLVKRSFLNEYPVTTIANGVNLTMFKPLTSIIALQKYSITRPYVLGLANIWNERKGLAAFIELSQIITSDIQIVLVGLKDADKSKVPDSIITISHTENTNELAELYSHAIAFINPTLEDNFPTVNIEALACGTPIITYDTGGSPEAIDHQTGFVVDKGDVEGLASAISKIQQQPREHYTELCRKRAIEYFNCEDRYQDVVDLYNEMINVKTN